MAEMLEIPLKTTYFSTIKLHMRFDASVDRDIRLKVQPSLCFKIHIYNQFSEAERQFINGEIQRPLDAEIIRPYDDPWIEITLEPKKPRLTLLCSVGDQKQKAHAYHDYVAGDIVSLIACCRR